MIDAVQPHVPVASHATGASPRASLDVPKLLAVAPILGVAEEIERHVGDLRRLAPASDATAALTLYRDKLAAALQRARRLELFVPVEAAAAVLGKSASMVTYLCRTRALKAKKVGGTWQIDRLDLERLRAEADGPAHPAAPRFAPRP
jgi:hypothetical protein